MATPVPPVDDEFPPEAFVALLAAVVEVHRVICDVRDDDGTNAEMRAVAVELDDLAHTMVKRLYVLGRTHGLPRSEGFEKGIM